MKLFSPVLANVMQRQWQHRQEILNKISSEEIFFILQEIFVILYTGMPYSLLIVCKSVLQAEIVLCRD
jgi:hypothetical protein